MRKLILFLLLLFAAQILPSQERYITLSWTTPVTTTTWTIGCGSGDATTDCYYQVFALAIPTGDLCSNYASGAYSVIGSTSSPNVTTITLHALSLYTTYCFFLETLQTASGQSGPSRVVQVVMPAAKSPASKLGPTL